MKNCNEEYLQRFFEARELAKGSEGNYTFLLKQLDGFLAGKDFKEVTEEDFRSFLRTRKHLKPGTRSREKILFKSFFRSLHGYRKYTYPPCVDWIQTSNRSRRLPVVNANDILSEDDVKKIIKGSTSHRDRAMWMALWEGAIRIGELRSMRVGSLVFDEFGCYAIVDGKSGQRRIRFVQATPYIRAYLNVHPDQDNPQSYLWVSESHKNPLFPSSIRRNLEKSARRSGLKKKVWPHLFRHSRLTLNAKFMTEAELCIFAGWQQGSSQSRVYVHLAGVDIDDKILEHFGLKSKGTEKNGEAALKPLVCPRCSEVNPATNKLCYKCNSHLILEEAVKAEKLKSDEFDKLKEKMAKMEQENLNLKDRINGLTEGKSREIEEMEAKIEARMEAKIEVKMETKMEAKMEAKLEKRDRRWMKIVGDFERMLRDSKPKGEKGKTKEKTSA